MPETGLYLGKFSPLHKGHEYVIETALEEVDELLVVIYDSPHVTETPLSVRADWIRELYPNVEVVESWTGPTETGYSDHMKAIHERHILELIDGRDIDRFYSSEPYGEHMSAGLEATDRRVDPDRETVPISATKVRKDTYGNREFVSDRVYRDLITNVVFLGGPSTGKTTLARELAEEYETEWMPEYGREYWEEHQVDRRLTKQQLLEIAEGHRQRENEALSKANEYLFVDTNAVTTYLFSQYYHGSAVPELERLAENCASRYDVVFVCGMDIPYDDTWDRSGEGNRERLQKQTLAYLNQHNIPYYVLEGSVKERMTQVQEVLERFEKYQWEKTA